MCISKLLLMCVVSTAQEKTCRPVDYATTVHHVIRLTSKLLVLMRHCIYISPLPLQIVRRPGKWQGNPVLYRSKLFKLKNDGKKCTPKGQAWYVNVWGSVHWKGVYRVGDRDWSFLIGQFYKPIKKILHPQVSIPHPVHSLPVDTAPYIYIPGLPLRCTLPFNKHRYSFFPSFFSLNNLLC